MAMAAARAIAARRAKKQREQKDKLIAQAKLAMVTKLDSAQQKRIVRELQNRESTAFLAELVKANPERSWKTEAEEEEEIQKSKTKAAPAIELPLKQPRYLSSRHYEYLKSTFSKPSRNNPMWLTAYVGGPRINQVHPLESDTKEAINQESVAKVEEIEAPVEDVDEDDDDEIEGANVFDSLEKNAHVETITKVEEAVETLVMQNPLTFQEKLVHWYNEFVCINQVIIASAEFSNIVMVAIITAGILVGIQTYPAFYTDSGLLFMNDLVQYIFTADVLFKIFQEGPNPLEYWLGENRAWNNFDCWLVVVCFLPPSAVGGNVAFIRLLRLMRLLKLVGKVKRLQVIVVGLAKGLGSVTYIVLLLLLVFYLFAVLGVGTFRRNDPFHFGSIGFTMIQLFRFSTLDNWTVALMINYFGCDAQYDTVNGFYMGKDGYGSFAWPKSNQGRRNRLYLTQFGRFPKNECWKPRKNAVIATCYFVLFILLAAFIILSLFIGAVCGGMGDALEAFEAEEAAEVAKRKAAEEALADPNAGTISMIHDFYDMIDNDGSGEIDAEEFLGAMKKFGKADMTLERVQQIIAAIDQDGDSTVSLKEFVYIVSERQIQLYRGSDEEEKATLEERAKWEADMVQFLLVAWNLNFEEKKAIEEMNKRRPWRAKYIELSVKAQDLADNTIFKNTMILAIFMAGTLVGIQTELAFPGKNAHYEAVEQLDLCVLIAFTIECTVKIVACGVQPLLFFDDSWNKFDFFIVAACWVFMLPFLPAVGSLLSMLRLLRLLRVLKLVKAFPELRVIISALISGFGSMSFVTIILFMFFYLYANIGIILFRTGDPRHYGSLQIALLTLFRVATGDGWSDLLYLSIVGCDQWQYGFGRVFNNTAFKNKDNCNHPSALGWIGIVYYVSFCVLGMQVLLTLFIGIIATSMEDAKAEMAKEKKRETRIWERAKTLGIDLKPVLESYEAAYKYLDDGDGKISRDEFKPILPCLNKIRQVMVEAGVAAQDEDPRVLTRPDVGKLFEIFNMCDEHFQGDGVDFPEFLVVLDFFRRAVFDPTLIKNLRSTFQEAERLQLVADLKAAQLKAANMAKKKNSLKGTASKVMTMGRTSHVFKSESAAAIEEELKKSFHRAQHLIAEFRQAGKTPDALRDELAVIARHDIEFLDCRPMAEPRAAPKTWAARANTGGLQPMDSKAAVVVDHAALKPVVRAETADGLPPITKAKPVFIVELPPNAEAEYF